MNSRTPQPPSHLTPQEARKPSLNPTLRFSKLCGVHLLGFIFYLSSFILSPAAPPPELTILRQQYDKVVAERVTAPFDASKAALDTKFTTALDNAITAAQQAGKLDDILAIQDDKKRLAEKLPLPDDDDKTPDAIKKLRGIYRSEVKKLEEARASANAAILPPYTTKLQTLEVTLTKAGRFDEAKELRMYREGLAEGRTEPSATSLPAPVIAGTSAKPEAMQKGGVLKGLGQFMFGNLPVDLTQAEGVTDFVEIKVSHMGWIARRANGEVRFQIQAYGDKTSGASNKKKAVRVCATEGKPFLAIYEDGSIEVLGTKFDKSNAFPSDILDVTDVDTASGLHLVLHRDGACSFHGKLLQDMITGLKLKAPGVLPGVTAVSCSRYQAYFLMKDGSVTATTDFRDKAPAWADLPSDFKRGIRSLAVGATGTQFAAITARGDAIQADGKEFNRKLKDLVEVKAGGIAVIAKDALSKWQIVKPGDDEMKTMLSTAMSSPQIIDIDLHNFDNDGKNICRAVFWIEPAP